MATKKITPPPAPAAKGKPAPAAVKKPGTALVPWEQQMAEAATKAAAAEKPMGGFKAISTRGGILSVDENAVEGNELRVVVLGAVHENQYYTKAFNPNKAEVPDCYAFGDPKADDPEDGMAPHEETDEEKRQGDDNGLCASCWANQMGSADVGKGKACKNVRRLAVVTEDALESADAMLEAEVRVLKVPVMSVKNWANYVRNTCAEELKRPAWGVVTKIKVVPDPKSQFKITFGFEELVTFDQELYDAVQKRVNEVLGALVVPYPKMEDQPEPPPRGRPQPVRGPVSRKAPLPTTAPITKGKPPVKTIGGAKAAKY